MNSHKKPSEIYHANGVKAQKKEYSNGWNPLCSSCRAARSSVGADGGRASSRTQNRGRRPRLQNILICPANVHFSVGAGGGRARKGDKFSSKKGAAIVELALAMLLMMSMILFSVFVCRAMSERNRSLAASRTVAWLYSHADDPEGKDRLTVNELFNQKLREWHFTPSRAIEVVVEPKKGMMANGDAEDILSAAKSQNDATKALDDKPEGKDPWVKYLGEFTGCIIKFLTGDYEYCRATVVSSVPLTFGIGFYQLFGWFNEGTSEHTQAKMQRTFVSSCSMPMQSGGEGVKDPFGALVKLLQEVKDLLEKLMKALQESNRYRPLSVADRTLDKEAFQALLMYEIYDRDHAKLKKAATAGAVSENWEGITVTFHPESELKELLDQCKAKKYTGTYGQ